jgi:hypothetical protein
MQESQIIVVTYWLRNQTKGKKQSAQKRALLHGTPDHA